jgi:hypothetical protein
LSMMARRKLDGGAGITAALFLSLLMNGVLDR